MLSWAEGLETLGVPAANLFLPSPHVTPGPHLQQAPVDSFTNQLTGKHRQLVSLDCPSNS